MAHGQEKIRPHFLQTEEWVFVVRVYWQARESKRRGRYERKREEH
jgi:hypothetical protein